MSRTATARTEANATGARRRARAPLAARIALGVAAALLAAVATLAGVNLAADSSYGQATATLTSNLKQAAKDDADLDTLEASQRQTDAQFADAQALSPVLAPPLRDAIARNAEVSRTLTERIAKARQQAKGQADTSEKLAAQAQNGGGQGGGLTAEQRRQVEDLLASNQRSAPPSDGQGDAGDESGERGSQGDQTSSQTAKPW
ncbi:cell surface protein [Bifidobacterium pullorum subsp. saeculare]|uniref:Cell surface protein n=1 Tax=Bifidobacterium pullorum subsp. saeculare TaxID=78257 RepID=A0A939B7H7_9BIFI|nr:DUF6466 family protein [Bifidobacterium pullorum]MBM6698852.1 cell surface protein [Bifidobacterium pullorum subsp. saeculare]